MQNYLRSISFQWITEACESAYFKALNCPKSFWSFWETHQHKKNVGDAITACLEALEETGIDEDNRELRVMWVESFDIEGESGDSSEDSDEDAVPSRLPTNSKPPCEELIVALFRSEYTWTGLLEDSEESMTVATMSMTCLDFDHRYGRRCSQSALAEGYPVLQTFLQINKSILENAKLKQEENRKKTIWNARRLEKGTCFSLGDHGILEVFEPARRCCPTIMEWEGIISKTWQEVKNVAINEKLLGKNAERHHCEHIRGKLESDPLPILVLSKSKKVTFSEG